jgi:ribosomal protein L34E
MEVEMAVERHTPEPQSWSSAPVPDGTLPFDPQPLPPLPEKWSARLADAPAEGVWQRFDQMKISCTMTMCDANLHCFRLTKQMAKTLSPGSCRECGLALVSLERTAARDLDDIDATFAALQRECIRHYFWHVPFGQTAMDYALRKGRRQLEACIEPRIRSRVGRAQHPAEGRQTPVDRTRANALDFAQHAVAACCRKCAAYWHGIPEGRPLTDEEVGYLSELVRRYLLARLPDLSDEPSVVPRRRRRAEVHALPTPRAVPTISVDLRRPHAS